MQAPKIFFNEIILKIFYCIYNSFERSVCMYMHEFQCLEWALEEYALLSGSDYL